VEEAGATTGAVIRSLPLASLVARLLHIAAPATHDFHVSYTRMAVEGATASAQVRVFLDDITDALTAKQGGRAIGALSTPAAEAVFAAYLAESMPVRLNGQLVRATIASSRQDGDMWAYIVTWQAPARITQLQLHNALLFERFDDQSNMVKVRDMAAGRERTLVFAGQGRTDQVVRF
jgi:hypothetical protein